MPGRGDREQLAEFVDTFGVTDFPHVVDPNGALWIDFGVTSNPAIVLISADGTRTRHLGATDPQKLKAQLEALL